MPAMREAASRAKQEAGNRAAASRDASIADESRLLQLVPGPLPPLPFEVADSAASDESALGRLSSGWLAVQRKSARRSSSGDAGGVQDDSLAPRSSYERTVLHNLAEHAGDPLDSSTRSFLEFRLSSEAGQVQPLSNRAISETPQGSEDDADRAAHATIGNTDEPTGGSRHDLSAVRVHHDQRAADTARSLGAVAYAVGEHIVFGSGSYRPDTPWGVHLLAHEVAHLLQQGRTGRQSIDRFEARVHESAERVGLAQGGAMSDEEASATYFGNWMRDINQAFVPALLDALPADVVFSLISYMAASKFGRELTPEQLGYYIPAEHIDNPAGMVKNDDFLAGPPAVSAAVRPGAAGRLGAIRSAQLDTLQEDTDPATGKVQGSNLFAVDQSGVMAYIRRSNLHVERRLELAAAAGRTPDGMQHFGAALHAMEDLFAHSNYVEIAVDRLLRTDPKFLPALTTAADRQVFTYSRRADVAASPGQPAQSRPALTTGTFTSADTQISLTSELVGVLSRPLAPPASNEERHAQDRFVVSLLRAFESRLHSNPALQSMVRNAATKAGVPSVLAGQVDKVPLATIYETSKILKFDIPDAVRVPLKTAMRDLISSYVLKPIAARVQAAGLEARISDTSLISALRESKRQEAGVFTDIERESMQQMQNITGQSMAKQEALLRAKAQRRVQAIRGTPLHVVAGPSHSQIAKDHPSSPFFGLAFTLATIAIHRMRDRMLAAWADRLGAPTAAFDFDWGANYPSAPPASVSAADRETYEESRRLFHAGRPGRGIPMAESAKFGRDIVAGGGAPGQGFDLSAMRKHAADRIRMVAGILRQLAGTPAAVADGIARTRPLANAIDGVTATHLAKQIADAQAALLAAGNTQTVITLNAVADGLVVVANDVQKARRHDDRQTANEALVAQRRLLLSALVARSTIDVNATSALLYVLDEQIQSTAVAYTKEQRDVLEGTRTLPEMGATPAGVTVTTLSMPSLAGSPATVALMTEARTLLAHPYDNAWWEPHVRSFAASHPDQLMNDIEARNEGVPYYRH